MLVLYNFYYNTLLQDFIFEIYIHPHYIHLRVVVIVSMKRKLKNEHEKKIFK